MDTEMNFEHDVGDILWIIKSDTPGLLAVQVLEVITKKTLSGTDIQYSVISTNPRGRAVLLSSLKGRVFRELEDAKQALYDGAKNSIDKIVSKVKQSADEAFNAQPPSAQSTEQPQFTQKLVSKEDEGEYQTVVMDGKEVRVKLPSI